MSQTQAGDLDRRSLLVGAGALASSLAVGALVAPGSLGAQRPGHGAHAAPVIKPPAHPALIRSSLDCVHTGDICIDHCFETFQAGDTSLAECVRRVQALVASCGALARLASLDAKYLAEFATVTSEICRHCEEECRRHAHHKPCKDCGEACAACAKECDKLKA
jgi:Cys-rich four helix bundle protein (predicted Tat secretion target)